MIFDAKPSVIGHRGYGAGGLLGYPENTPPAFTAAARAGATWVELDARRSSDGVLMVWHDPVAPSGALLIERTAADLAAEGLSRLTDLIGMLPAAMAVDIDVKTVGRDAVDAPGERTHALVAAFLSAFAGTRRFLVTSFDPSLPCFLAGQGLRSDRTAFGLLAEVRSAAETAISAAANLGLDAVCLHTSSLERYPGRDLARGISIAHAAGLEVMVWTVTPARAADLAAAGADALCVDDIPATLTALAAAGETG